MLKNKRFCHVCSNSVIENRSKEKVSSPENIERKHALKVAYICSLSIGFIFLVTTALLILFLQQRNTEENKSFQSIEYPLSERIVSTKVQNTDYSVNKAILGEDFTKKVFDDRGYTYDRRTSDFRLVCSYPCPVSTAILDQEYAAIAYAVATLRGLTRSDLDQDLLPFEVHASEDEVCSFSPGAGAYMTESFVDDNGYQRGLLCFFFDKIPYDRSKFPYSASVHEVTHLFEYKKLPYDYSTYTEGGSVLWEGLSEVMDSFFLKGNDPNSFCWEGNNQYGEIYSAPSEAHEKGRQLFHDLCKEYGFDYDGLPELFRTLDNYRQDYDRVAPIEEFIKIINRIVGQDTTILFKNAGVV